MTEPAEWGQLGPAMRELSERQRAFVMALVTGRPGHGALTAAARFAGYNMSGPTLNKHAHDLSRNPKIIAAIAEEAKKVIRGTGYGEAISAIQDHPAILRIVTTRGRSIWCCREPIPPSVSTRSTSPIARWIPTGGP